MKLTNNKKRKLFIETQQTYCLPGNDDLFY